MRALRVPAVTAVLAACASPAPPPHGAPSPPAAPPRDAPIAIDAPRPIDAPAVFDAPIPVDAPPPIDAAAAAPAPLKRATIGARGCPTTFDANALECTKPQQLCRYPQGACICMPHCSGGAAVRPLAPGEQPPGPRWECYPTPKRTDGCPARLPSGKCTGDLRCSYGRIETGLCWGATVQCTNGVWMGVQVPPPP